TVIAGGERVAVAGTGIGPSRVPHLVEVQGRRLTIELARYVTVFRYQDVPGMIGRVGTIFGGRGGDISAAGVAHAPHGGGGARGCTERAAAARGHGGHDRRGGTRRAGGGDRRDGRLRRRLVGRHRLTGRSADRLGCRAHAGGGDHQARGTGGAGRGGAA